MWRIWQETRGGKRCSHWYFCHSGEWRVDRPATGGVGCCRTNALCTLAIRLIPYGTKSPDVVRLYACENSDFLMNRDLKMLMVACNPVSAMALEVSTAQPGMVSAGRTNLGPIKLFWLFPICRTQILDDNSLRLSELGELPC